MSTSLTSRVVSRALEARAVVRGCAVALLLVLATALAGCSPESLAGNAKLPPDVPDPAEAATPAGAMAAYRGALVQLKLAFGGDFDSFVPVTGLLSDELGAGDGGLVGNVTDTQLLDSRTMTEQPPSDATSLSTSVTYGLLQNLRGQVQEARGALRAYMPDSSQALVGHLDAVEGYAETFLADLFCSGVPLSTLDFNGDYTLRPGSTTDDVYAQAIAHFDSALALAADSERILDLARVGKARALLARGDYAAAGAAVAAVPDDYRYVIGYSTITVGGSNGGQNKNFASTDFFYNGRGVSNAKLTMVEREGGNGLAYLSSGDPRTPWVSNGTSRYGLALTRPANYSSAGDTPIVLASGVEARLIQAEAALDAGDASWLATLNALRTDGTYDTQQDPADTTKTDTLWHAGTGGVAGLAPLTDPGMADGRVDLVFHERAFWLFLTGHRQGDLRRLIRNYGRSPDAVYPTGTYLGAYGIYGTDVDAPVPSAERESNPYFTGCLSRGA